MKRRDCLQHFLGALIAPASAAGATSTATAAIASGVTLTNAASLPSTVRTRSFATPSPAHPPAADATMRDAPASKLRSSGPAHSPDADDTLPHWLEDWRALPLHPVWSSEHVPARWRNTAAAILCAIQSRTHLTIEYSANNSHITRRTILPVLLHTKREALAPVPAGIPRSPFSSTPTLYLLAWCDTRQDHRTFCLHGIIEVHALAA